jgi:CDGSH-type Zn-finger protein/uncharacterized Fe-S cluster protein YjdI
MTEANIIVEHREELVYLLTEAAEIEHGLMCCYLFAAFSLKRDDSAFSPEERAAVARWRAALLDVARDEMLHLSLVSNLLSSLGSAPHFGRSNFPVSPGYHPAGVVVSLAPFDRATLDHFIYLERPEGMDLPDGAGFEPRHYERPLRVGRLVPSAQDYLTVGHLYRGLRAGFAALVAASSEKSVFVGDHRLQIGADTMPLAGVRRVRSLADVDAAIDTIVTQGEGAPGHAEGSHFARFSGIREEYEALLARNPGFAPAYPVARNPVMRKPPEASGKVWIDAEPAATLLDLANAAYALMLRSIQALFSAAACDGETRQALVELSLVTMRGLTPLAERLAALPASAAAPGVHAGMTFTMSRSLLPPTDRGALRGLVESCALLSGRLGAPEAGADPAITSFRAALDRLASRLDALALRVDASPPAPAPPAPAPPAPASAAPAAPPSAEPGVEVARGKALTVLFEGKRCIHARHCVLQAPRVFLANTPGEWIFPDEMSSEALIGVAHACPSGAIRYERHDGGPAETPPPVNVIRIRENGPLAVHAELHLAGRTAMTRATLCRCGASKNKPFCDGSHVAAGFQATGEPVTVDATALAQRAGALVITPRLNGPLGLTGNVEICGGTGRTVHRTTAAALCRCGGSQNKPFCDGTHARNGFTADGE